MSLQLRKIPVILLFVLVSLISLSLGSWLGYQKLEKAARGELFRYQSLIRDLLERHQVMAPVLATNSGYLNLLYSVSDEPDPDLQDLYNRQLKNISDEVKMSSEIYIMDSRGITLAASNWQSKDSFVGSNFSFRPYFQQGINGQDGFYFALGLNSGIRGLYFSAPIWDGDKVAGVLAIKINVPELEELWKLPGSGLTLELVVTDDDGIVFLSSENSWRYRSLFLIDEKRLQSIAFERRYPEMTITPIGLEILPKPAGLSDQSQYIEYQGEHFVQVRQKMEDAGWNLSVFAGTGSVSNERLRSLMLALFFTTTIVGVLLFQQERQARLSNLESSRRDLENRVAQRTQDLQLSNHRLQQEVLDRLQAEQRLKDIQDELIQAAKLATLGQMSASINHELNQPLTAIKAFTGNARKFIQRGKVDMADQNLGEILGLCDRMGKIISQFKLFSRKSSDRLVAIDLQQILFHAKALMRPVIDEQKVRQKVSGMTDPVWVAGDMVRLEQVMVNLISNAVQATEDAIFPEIETELLIEESTAIIRVMDNGPGLTDTQQIFEPFFTTKGVTKGLGLGLSISRQIIEAMNGSLTAYNRDTGGACFEVRLPLMTMKEVLA